MCYRCKRKCLTHAAFCERGEHCVHYYCDKLTPQEIDRLQEDVGFIYICKLYHDTDNTDPKTIVRQDADASPSAGENIKRDSA